MTTQRRERIAIRAAGLSTPIGHGVEAFWSALLAGTSGISRIERFPGRSLLLRVTHVPSRRVVKGAPSEFARIWNARVAEDGDYRVDVVRTASPCAPPITYLLTIGLQR